MDAYRFPGLVNAHSHAFQRLLRGRTEYVAAGRDADTFWTWRERMYQAATALSPDDVYVASRQAFLEMALAGITSVGEFHYLHHTPQGTPYDNPHEMALRVIQAARDVGLRIALLRVGYARAGHGVPENPRQRRFIDKSAAAFLEAATSLRDAVRDDPLVTVGLAPHSVRAVPRPWLQELAGQRGILHMHVAEQPGEIEACVAEHGKRPVELLGELGLLRPGFTAVHAIHLQPNELSLLGQGGASVCACPSTERNLGDGVVPADLLAAAGVRLCLGTDGQASIDLLDEACALEGHLRLVRQRRAVLDPGTGTPDGLAQRLLGFATENGARSLGIAADGDFFTVDARHPGLEGVQGDALLPALLSGGGARFVREVTVGGRTIVQDGVHPLAETIQRDYAALCQRLFA